MNRTTYEAARAAAREMPDAFWSNQAHRLDWITRLCFRDGPDDTLAVSTRL